jgi:hypothetical protein
VRRSGVQLGGLEPSRLSAGGSRGRGMKPYVICHMNSSVDGRILGSRWRPSENRMAGLFERIHETNQRVFSSVFGHRAD